MKRNIQANAVLGKRKWTLCIGTILTILCLAVGQIGLAETPELQNARTVAEGQAGYHDSASGDIAGGTVNARIDAGASGRVEVGDNGARVSGEAGVSANIDGEWDLGGIGDENFGADAELRAELEAVIGAKGEIGAYIDDTGITIGAEAEGGAYVSADVELDFDVRVFGVETNLKLRAAGSAGLHAGASAKVHVGFDGNVEFSLGAGLVVGVGAQFDVSFGMDIVSLMNALGFGDDMGAFYDWLERFQQDPESMLGDLFDAVGDAVLHNLSWGILGRSFDEQVEFGGGYQPGASLSNNEVRNPDGLDHDAVVNREVGTPPPPQHTPPQDMAPYQKPEPLKTTPYQWPGPYKWPAPLRW